MKSIRFAWLFPFSVLLVGCHFTTFADPNNPSKAGALQPEVLRRQVKGASDALYTRCLAGEITEEQYQDLLAGYADDLIKSTDIKSVDPSKAWEYGDVFRTARLWKAAEGIYRVAVKAAKDEDRRVNDSLFLAECLSHEGKVEEALKLARTTFDTPAESKAPILYGVLYNIAPSAQAKGKDEELARLLEDAVHQSDLTKVNESTPEGHNFLMALPHHQRNARELAAKLYRSAGSDRQVERVLSGKLPTIRI